MSRLRKKVGKFYRFYLEYHTNGENTLTIDKGPMIFAKMQIICKGP